MARELGAWPTEYGCNIELPSSRETRVGLKAGDLVAAEMSDSGLAALVRDHIERGPFDPPGHIIYHFRVLDDLPSGFGV
jgi:hypothetical protein